MKTKNKQLIYACLMTLSGFAVASIKIPQTLQWSPDKQPHISQKPFTIPQIMPSVSFVTKPPKETAKASSFVSLSWSDLVTDTVSPSVFTYYQPSVMVLNLSGMFPEGADTSDRLNSLAGEIFKELSLKDSQWLTNIYLFPNHTPAALAEGLGLGKEQVLGKYNPKDKSHDPENPDTWTVNTWENTRITFHDGDGGVINGYSNVKELLSMGSVYTFYQGMEDTELFQDYVNTLWEKSHDYSVHMSDVYYCNGCISEEEYQSLPHSLLEESSSEAQTSQEESQALQMETQASQVETQTIQVETQASQPEAQASQPETESMEVFRNPEVNAADDSLSGQNPALLSLEGFTENNAQESDGSGTTEAASETRNPVLEEQFREVEGPGREAMMSEAAKQSQADQTTESIMDTTIVSSVKGYCPGHLDMSVDVTVIGFDGSRNLFTIDDIGQGQAKAADAAGFVSTTGEASQRLWTGWDDSNQKYARCIHYQDWHQLYGLTVSSFLSISNPLSESEIQSYLEALPEDISDTRRQVVEFALRSVGKVPYYWGGKPYDAGYDNNSFGSVTRADEDGRVLRGLDCSGWINWVYWSATGKRLPYESTSGLVTCGAAISRDSLQPGDIIVRLGSMPHVVMFLSWAGDGQIVAIHESSDSNNVTVGTMTADWNNYRKLVE